MKVYAMCCLLLMSVLPVMADTNTDTYPNSPLFSKPVEVVSHVWSAIGATQPPTKENAGHNNNLSFIIGDDSVLVFNAGDSYQLAQALHQEIQALTDVPVRYVVLENAQGHAALGSLYWQQQGAFIIAHQDATDKIAQQAIVKADEVVEPNDGRYWVMPDISFDQRLEIQLGDIKVELIYFGEAHSAGDISAFLPEQSLIIAGDMAFHQRMLPVFPETKTLEWVKTFDKFVATGAKLVIPGHGVPTDMATVTKETQGYLQYLQHHVSQLLDNDLGLEEAYQIDQSAYRHLDTFDELAKKNAGRIFQEMELDAF